MDENRRVYTQSTTGPPATDDDAATNDWGIDKVAGSDWVLAMYSIICVVGVTGNLLVCIVLLRVPSLRSNTSDFLIHLSLVDLVVCILVIPYKIIPPLMIPASPTPIYSAFWAELRCKLYVSQYPFWVCAFTSVFSLASVTVERFVAIVHPHKYKRIFGRRRNKLLIIALCWLLAVLVQSYILFIFSSDANGECLFQGWPSRVLQVIVGLNTFAFVMIVPFFLMLSLQWKVIATLKAQVRSLTGGMASSDMNPTDRRKMWQLRTSQTLVRTLVAFAITFAGCWAPNAFMFLIYNLGVNFSFATPIYHFGVILGVCNSCVNPIIYTLTNRAFRKGIREAFCRPSRVGNEPTTSSVAMSLQAGSTNRPTD